MTAREHDCQFEWHVHEAEAVRQGVAPEIVDIVRHRRPTGGLEEADAALIDFGRELFRDHRVSPET